MWMNQRNLQSELGERNHPEDHFEVRASSIVEIKREPR
jgi:hypothetical protein